MKFIYRPEIDGLRAIAVLAVIIYHAQVKVFGSQLFGGGFIGVDIFFNLKKLNKNNKIKTNFNDNSSERN